MKYVVGLSGGKDSTAALLWTIHESGYSTEDIIPVFCDTGNECNLTYEYIEYLNDYIKSLGIREIVKIYPELNFYELAEKKKRFPSARARFCTEELKIKPLHNYLKSLDEEYTLISGVRRDESFNRRFYEIRYTKNGINYLNPLVEFSEEDVFNFIQKYGLKRNPLYDMGFKRVGCFPCIMSQKCEIKLIADKFPEYIDKIREEEKRLNSTFFYPKAVSRQYRRTSFTIKGIEYKVPSIDDVVEWSHTGNLFGRPSVNDIFIDTKYTREYNTPYIYLYPNHIDFLENDSILYDPKIFVTDESILLFYESLVDDMTIENKWGILVLRFSKDTKLDWDKPIIKCTVTRELNRFELKPIEEQTR